MKRSWWQRFESSSAHTQANIVCTILIAVATIAYAVIAYRQLVAIGGQLDQMSNQFPEIKRSADAAKSAADTSNAEFKISSRAWMTATLSNPGGVREGQPLLTIIDFVNTGKSPAVKVQTCQIAKIVDRKRASNLDINCPSEALSPGFQVILANASTKRMGNAAGGNNNPPIVPDGLLTPA
jgi:hypothetical protein